MLVLKIILTILVVLFIISIVIVIYDLSVNPGELKDDIGVDDEHQAKKLLWDIKKKLRFK